MKKELSWLKNLRGATAIEYAMIVAGISVAIMAVLFTMGDSLVAVFQKISVYLGKRF